MKIGIAQQPRINTTPPKAQEQEQQSSPKSGSDSMVENIVDNTYLSANYAASGLSGGASGLGAWTTTGVPQTLKSTASILSNMYKTEKIGPTLKTLALVAAVPVMAIGGAVAAPISLLAGVWQGANEVDSSTPRQFTVSQAAKESYTEVQDGLNKVAKGIQEEMTDLGNYKLAPNEKPIDVPLIKAGKTVIMGAIGVAIGGVAGLVSALAATGTEMSKGVAKAFTSPDLGVGGKILAAGTSVLSAPVHGALFGLRTGLATVGNSLTQTWDKDSVVSGAKSIFEDAKNGIAASVAPNAILTQVKTQ